ncbi:cullin family protein (macronuclear) [Tetrahymena thermophila SB210]|uniref:Cullin family protein n=1 Tax=Tetrahymena thermophila (strain SB210) TaxID=312017 RepID=I7MDD1_TETTS|nr:cullin family protein [Tetrahymena thermophila SB210]EAR87357.2 cullin family protein [Tetrahymena thermophila SB210]|eukprot:XP_001007602.2 cullin family protein [Tetrahymena thermophila SB210]
MKILKKIPKIFYKIRKLLANNQYEDINKLFSQDKYANLFQNVYQLDGKQVQLLVDEIMINILDSSNQQLKLIFKGKSSDDDSTILNQFQKILRDQLIQIYFISVFFYQFDELIFKGLHQVSLQQYCLQKVLDSSNGKFSMKIVDQIVKDLNKRKQLEEQNERFSQDLLQIINFFSCRTFLNQLYLDRQSYDFQISVLFNCDFTEEEAEKLIRYQEKKRIEEEKFKQLMEDDSSSDENKQVSSSQKSLDQQEIEQEQEEGDQSLEIELENKKSKKKKRVIESKSKKEKKKKEKVEFESIFSLIEEKYIQKLKSDSEEFIDRIKDEKLEDQITQIEEYIFREQQFISYYMNRISIKVSDLLQKMCIYQNYPKLINHQKYGLTYCFNNQNYKELKLIYNFVQNDNESIKTLSQKFNSIVESVIQKVEKEQEIMFEDYKKEQQNQAENYMQNSESKDENLEKDIQYIQNCQQKWIKQIYEIYLIYYQNGLVQAFDNNPTLNTALSRAFESQFNSSELAVDYLVNSCHQYLLNEKFRQTSLELKEDEFENFISKIFSYIFQKDQFLEIYRKLLSRRLIYKQSQGEKQELKYLEYFEKSIGLITQIDHMKQMIQDLNKSDLIKFDYYEQMKKINKDNQDQKSKNSLSSRSRSRSRSRSKSIESRSEKSNKRRNNGIQIDISDDNSEEEIEIISQNSRNNNNQIRRNNNHQIDQIVIDDNAEIEQSRQDNLSQSEELIMIDNSQRNQEVGQMRSNSRTERSDSNQLIQIEDSDQNNSDEDLIISETKPTKQKGKRYLLKKNQIIIDEKEENEEEGGKHNNNSQEIKNSLIDVMILTNMKWPLKLSKTNANSQIILPKALQRYYQEYSESFRKVFKNQRKLDLLHHVSYSTLQFKSDSKLQFGGTYLLQVSSYSMIILLCFNKNNSISVQELKEKTGINKKIIKEKLNILSKFNILKLKITEDNKDQQSEKNKKNYEVNTDFYAKTQDLEIDSIPQEQFYSQQILQNLRADAQTQKSQKEINSNIINHRKVIINSYIVQIMKDKETLHKDELIKLVQQKLKDNKQIFIITDSFVKDQIQSCIDQDYLKNSQEQDILLYVK